MSQGYLSTKKEKVTVLTLQKKKVEGQRISMITCYDSAFGKIIDASPIDCVLVGDSMGNTILGYDNTLPVTLEDILHHTKAVARVTHRPFLIADMPFMSYQVSVELAVRNAGRLIQEGGAHAVKLEGGKAFAPHVRAMTQAGIPVVGHLGLTPQSVHSLGGYRVQGRQPEAEQRMIEDAQALVEAGICLLVLELVPRKLAKQLTDSIKVPTIGIGAGVDTNGQVLVLHDMLGFDTAFTPKFLKRYGLFQETISQALAAYHKDVTEGQFPDAEHSFE